MNKSRELTLHLPLAAAMATPMNLLTFMGTGATVLKVTLGSTHFFLMDATVTNLYVHAISACFRPSHPTDLFELVVQY